jgi:hypothetical protein
MASDIWLNLDTALERYFGSSFAQEGDLKLFRDLFGRHPNKDEIAFRESRMNQWPHEIVWFDDVGMEISPPDQEIPMKWWKAIKPEKEKNMASEPVDKSMLVLDKADIHIRYVPGREAPYILNIVKRSGSGVTLGDTRIQVALHGAELMRLVDMLDPRLIEADSTINGCNKKLREAVIAKEKAESALLDERAACLVKKGKKRLIVKASGSNILFDDASTVLLDFETKSLVVRDADGVVVGEFSHYDYYVWEPVL